MYRNEKQIKQKRNFGSNGKILYLNFSGGYTGIFVNTQQYFKWVCFIIRKIYISKFDYKNFNGNLELDWWKD